jgi:hypothetical protein
MEKLKPGRKPLPPEQKRALVAAFLTKAEKELIINKYGSLSHAVKHEILSKIHADGHSNSVGDGQPLAGQ